MSNARRAALTMDAVRQWTRVQLGGTSIEVELDDTDLDSCIADALAVLSRHAPEIRTGIIPEPRTGSTLTDASGVGSSNRYVVDLPGLVEVADVHFLRKTQFIEYMGIENPFYLDAVQKAFRGGSMGEYLADMVYLESAKKVFSSHPEWYGVWEPVRGTEGPDLMMEYALYVDISNIGLNFTLYLIGFFAYVGYEASDNPESGLPRLGIHYHHWLREYTKAKAKQILARKLNKFGGIPEPTGGDSMTDGLSLMTEGLQAQERLEADALSFQVPIPPMTE